MPDYLAIQWNEDRLVGIEAQVSRQQLTIRQFIELDWPEGQRPASAPEEAGRWLSARLNEAGVGGRPVLLALPREEFVTRQLQVPDAPDDELPALVRLQAATRSSTPLDQLLVDFLPLERTGEQAGRDVLVFTVPKKKADNLLRLFQAAGLTVAGMTPGVVGLGELVVHAEAGRSTTGDSSEGATLVVVAREHGGEAAILWQRHLLLTHAFRLPSGEDVNPQQRTAAIVGEVRRALVTLRGRWQDLRVGQTWLTTSENNDAVAEALARAVGSEVYPLRPFELPSVHSVQSPAATLAAELADPLGLLLQKSQCRTDTVDFLHPRQPRVRRDPRKVRLVAGAAALLVAVIAGVVWRSQAIGRLDDDIANLRSTAADMEKFVKDGQSKLAAAEAVGGWVSRAADPLERIREFNTASAGPDRIYLQDYTISSDARGTEVHVTGTARARTDADRRDLFRELAAAGYDVHATRVETSKDSAYPIQFAVDISLTTPKNPVE